MNNTNTITIRAEGASAVKVERPLPEYRLVRKNGTLALQRAYGWACGTDGGVDWRDEPTIEGHGPDSLAEANRILGAALEGRPVTEAEILWALRETGDF